MSKMRGRTQFQNHVGDSNSVNLPKWRAHSANGNLNKSNIRSIFWKVFLGAVDPDDLSAWADQFERHRRSFQELRSSVMVDPSTESNVSVDLNNPLATAEESPWARFFEDNELCDTIRLDLERTYPDTEFFQTETAQTQMLNILFTWCKTNSDVSYRQGMNELLAPMLLVVTQDSQVQGRDGSDVYSITVDADYVEHDTYWLFAKIMETMKPYFQHTKGKSPRTPLPGQKPPEQPIIKKCKYIQTKLLGQIDPELSRYLDSQDIEPQLYGLRWIRLMFTREFHLEDVLILWDAIFAENVGSSSLSFIDYLACAMLLYIKEQLLERQSHEVLRRILKYPPVEDVSVLVQAALQCRDPAKRNRIVSRRPLNPKPKVVAQPRHVDPAPQPRPRGFLNARRSSPQKQQQKQQSGKEIRGMQAPGGRRPQRGPSAPNFRVFNRNQNKQPKQTKKQKQAAQENANRDLTNQVKKLSRLNSSMGFQLESIVTILQDEASQARDRDPDLCETCEEEVSSLTTGPGVWVDEDVFFNALAELKQVQAVLTGLLDPSECVWAEEVVMEPLRKASITERHEPEKEPEQIQSTEPFDPFAGPLDPFDEQPEPEPDDPLSLLNANSSFEDPPLKPDNPRPARSTPAPTNSSRARTSPSDNFDRSMNFPTYDGPSATKPFLFSKHTTIPEYKPDAELFGSTNFHTDSHPTKTANSLLDFDDTSKYDFEDAEESGGRSDDYSEEEDGSDDGDMFEKSPARTGIKRPKAVEQKNEPPILVGDDNPLGF